MYLSTNVILTSVLINVGIPDIRVFGPTKAAARLEGSKTFAKDFMAKYNIPTARFRNFTKYEEARNHVDEVQYDVVIKATGRK